MYGSHAAAVAGGAAAGEAVLSAGDRLMLWLGPAAEDKLPKDATGGGVCVWRGGGEADATKATGGNRGIFGVWEGGDCLGDEREREREVGENTTAFLL